MIPPAARNHNSTGPFVRLVGALYCLASPWTVMGELASVIGAIFFVGAMLVYPHLILWRLVRLAGVSLFFIVVSEYVRAGISTTLVNEVLAAVVVVLPASAVAALDREDRLSASRWLIAGATVSSVLGVVALQTPGGQALGLASHRNQLGFCSAAVVLLLTSNRRHPAAWCAVGILLLAIVMTGSRSGLVALLVGAALVSSGWIRRRPRRILAVLLAGVTAYLGAGAAMSSLAGSQGARLLDANATESSDSARAELLDQFMGQVDALSLVIGDGFALNRAPHNIWVELLVVGGAGAVAGMALLVVRPATQAILQHGDSVLTARALAVVVVFVGLSANNALWAPFVWIFVGLFEAADRRYRGPDLFGSGSSSSLADGRRRTKPLSAAVGSDGHSYPR